MKNLFDLTGKVALVVGGAGGIGQGIAKGLVAYGADVSIASRNEESLQRAQKEIKEEEGKTVSYYMVDAADESQVKNMAEQFIKDHKTIDILINAQGFNRKFPVGEFPMDVWDNLFAVNVKSVMNICQAFGPLMKKNGKGKIINLSSIRGIRGVGGGNSGYAATKGAIDMVTRTLAAELGPEVNVNAIGPTITETPMMKNILTDDLKKMLIGNAPLGRLGYVEDCIGPAIYLSSEASDFVTGQILYLDGGLTAIG